MSEFTSKPGTEPAAEPEPGNEEKSLGREMSDLCDDFSHFKAECAFLCDAFAAIVNEPECITETTSYGLSLTTYKLKCRVADYHSRMENILNRM